MTIRICPRCRKKYAVPIGVSDVSHQCHSGNPTLDQEDVVAIGDWTDYTGSGTVGPSQLKVAGIQNDLMYSEAYICDGETEEDRSPRGARKGTHRQRQHLEFIEDVNGGCD